jgi:hypothetical protein
MKKIYLLALVVLVAGVAAAQPGGPRETRTDGTHFRGPNPSDHSTTGWNQPTALLWDNGLPDGNNGYSNAADGVLGGGIRRTLLADFVVPGGETWDVLDLTWRHVWGSGAAPPQGTGAEISFITDMGGTPTGAVVGTAVVGTYTEIATGGVFFSRPEAESFAGFTAINLAPGTYWLDATIVGPENNFWLTSPVVNGTNCWVNYTDLGGLQDCAALFGTNQDISLMLGGNIVIPAELTGFEVE